MRHLERIQKAFYLPLALTLGAASGLAGAEEAEKASAGAAQVPSIAGRWYSYYGIMELEQTGATFSGTYSCCGGEIGGSFLGKRIEFTWKDAIYGEGWGYFFLEGGGNELRGMWGEKDDLGGAGQWGGVRMIEPSYETTPSRFGVENDHRRFGALKEGEALLAIDGERVEGLLTGYYLTEVQEKPFRVDLFLYLDGQAEAGGGFRLEWEDPRYGHYGEILLRREGEVLKGEWEPFGDAGMKAVIVFKAAR